MFVSGFFFKKLHTNQTYFPTFIYFDELNSACGFGVLLTKCFLSRCFVS